MRFDIAETNAAIRRGERIWALQHDLQIPHPETAGQDARPGNRDDAEVLAFLRRQAEISGFPPARQLAGKLRREQGNARLVANEALEAIGPQISGVRYFA